ncbi:hypothetical protein ACXNWJ_002984 [Acinetobacter baumannii]
MTGVSIKPVTMDEPLNIDELTQTLVDGTGVLDVLLKTMRTHLDLEFKAGRLRGPDYAAAYVGAYTATMQTAVQYALQKTRLGHELELLQAQVDQTQAQKQLTLSQAKAVDYETQHKAPAEVENIVKQGNLIDAQVKKAEDDLRKSPIELEILQKQSKTLDAQHAHTLKETEMLTAQINRVPQEIALLQKQGIQASAQTDQINAQTETIRTNAKKIPLEMELLEKQKLAADQQLLISKAQEAHVNAQTGQVKAATDNVVKQGLQVEAQTAQVKSQTKLVEANITKAPAEMAHLEAQTMLVNKQAQKLDKDVLLQAAQIELSYAQIELSKAELETKIKQLDLLKAQIAGQQAQSALYAQKVITERAQTDSTVIGAGSVLSVQNQMIKAQTDGFRRDAEQKAAKIFVDTWSVRRNTDNGTSGNADNLLNDANIGGVLTALLNGIGVTPKV